MRTSSTPSMKDISSSGLFLSSSTILGPDTTTIHCPISATLNTEPWNCDKGGSTRGQRGQITQLASSTYSLVALTKQCLRFAEEVDGAPVGQDGC